MTTNEFDFDLVVMGGGGHVGLPLSVMFASRGLKTCIFDTSESAVDKINSGLMPFWEPGAESILIQSLREGMISASTNPEVLSRTNLVVVVIGTPVDEHLNPDPLAISEAIESCRHYLRDGQVLVLRSTVFPGVTKRLEAKIRDWGLKIDIAFAPERIAEHNAVHELVSLPQIVASPTERGFEAASELFANLSPEILRLTPEEAELAKLFTNSWRYVKFAMANQFFMMAESQGLDYERIRWAMRHNYPRASDVPSAGFAAGPCLFKDTMQLAAFSNNNFQLGHSAMLINEGMPKYVVSQLESKYDLAHMRVGILGMAFKAGSDDIRSSLSYKLKNVLEFKALRVLTTDPMVSRETDPTTLPLEQVLLESDLLIIATPHQEYSTLITTKPIIDIWGILARTGQQSA